MTDLETRLRREMQSYVRTRPVARPPLDELLRRADATDPAAASASAPRPDRPRYLLTAVGIAAVAAAVVGVVVWRGEPERAVTAAPPPLDCALVTATGEPGGAGVPGAPDTPDAPIGGDVEIIVFLGRDVTDEQRTALGATFAADPRVTAYRYVDEAESREEFRRLFRRNQEMLERIERNPDLLPTSYRLELSPAGRQQVADVVAGLDDHPGVLRTTAASTCD